CVVQLEKVAESYVLDNIRAALTQSNRARWVQRIAGFRSETGKPVSLAGFLNYYELSLDALYSKASWSRLCADAHVSPDFTDPDEPVWSRGLRRVARMNGAANLRTLIRLLDPDGSDVGPNPAVEPIIARTLLMLHFTLWGSKTDRPTAIQGILARVETHPQLRTELLEMLRCRFDQLTTLTRPIPLPFPCPLELHADYTRDQILAGIGFWTLQSQRELWEGVLYVKDIKTDVLLNTLNKTEEHYSPTTMYRDYAISENLFHWQSQNATSPESPTGQRFIRPENDGTVLLFVREDRKTNGLAAPYTFLGPVQYAGHEGSRPMSIQWRLDYPMPVRFVDRTR
ncbi:MAG: DUF3427 domain-containing protein, partial [Proteobacteria bacterium]|nr:DUF3427 domain-containing protein [Pseudomonadota bacterium]